MFYEGRCYGMSHRKKRAPCGGIDECYWGELDNAAKLIPAITSTRSPNVFRFTAVLREEVVPEALQWALERALSIMPAFSLKLHRGVFWYYFDMNEAKPKVRPESRFPCTPIYRGREKGFLFRVTYFHKRINFELYHALSDGMGASNFMRLLVYCYFHRLHGDEVPEDFIRREAGTLIRDFDEDSFVVNVPDENEVMGEVPKDAESYRLGGYSYDGTRLGVISVIVPFDKLRALAKAQEASLSEYITALLIFSIYNTSYMRSSRKLPITISVPVNLRGMFDSKTLRNFFGHMNVSASPTKEMSFEDTLSQVKKSFDERLQKSNFEKQILNHVNIERIPGIRFVPLFIKDAVMRLIYARNNNKYTMTLSNLGRLTLPDNVADKVDRFEVVMGGSATHPKKLSLCTYGNQVAMSFSSTVDDNSLEQFFVSFLGERGIEPIISSNETPPPVKVKKPKAPKDSKSPKTKKPSKKTKNSKAKKGERSTDEILQSLPGED